MSISGDDISIPFAKHQLAIGPGYISAHVLLDIRVLVIIDSHKLMAWAANHWKQWNANQ